MENLGIVSYAGLVRSELLAGGKQALIQAEPPVPKRFRSFLPIFPEELVVNMEYLGAEAHSRFAAPSGFSADPSEYHRKLWERTPELYQGDNSLRNFDYEGNYVGSGAVTVDHAWIEHFPQYGPFWGDRLVVRLIGGGFQAVAVPESVFPRGGGMLEALEERLLIADHAQLFVQYAHARIAAGDKYDAESFQTDYLSAAELSPVTFSQSELGRQLQELAIAQNLQSGVTTARLYTARSRSGGGVRQYVPMRYACDLFQPAEETVMRLAQLCEGDFIGDLWIAYRDLLPYLDRQTMTVDAAALCRACQIAPTYDPATRGGCYPSQVRVAAVRDSSLKMLTCEARCNPAYGSGFGADGLPMKRLYLADSREMLRQRRLSIESMRISVGNAAVSPEDYRAMLQAAETQEYKGRLIDAMYRREAALTQIHPQTAAYDKARALLDRRVDALRAQAGDRFDDPENGYDADIAYLSRVQEARENGGARPHDALREESIETGYGMRSALVRMSYADAALPVPPPPDDIGGYESAEPAPLEDISAHEFAKPEPSESANDTPVSSDARDEPFTETVVEAPRESAPFANAEPPMSTDAFAETEAFTAPQVYHAPLPLDRDDEDGAAVPCEAPANEPADGFEEAAMTDADDANDSADEPQGAPFTDECVSDDDAEDDAMDADADDDAMDADVTNADTLNDDADDDADDATDADAKNVDADGVATDADAMDADAADDTVCEAFDREALTEDAQPTETELHDGEQDDIAEQDDAVEKASQDETPRESNVNPDLTVQDAVAQHRIVSLKQLSAKLPHPIEEQVPAASEDIPLMAIAAPPAAEHRSKMAELLAHRSQETL